MSRKEHKFSAAALKEKLSSLPTGQRYLVGFSGGVDSTALLAAISQIVCQLDASVEAIHFNHALNEKADSWQRHCLSVCNALGIPLHSHILNFQFNAGSSPETAAREARYSLIETLVQAGDLYLTAHQADDQAETLFLNLMRGSGADGLSGIPDKRQIGQGWLIRPLLEFRRSALQTWLVEEGLEWIDDPSNTDDAMDRNYVRNSLFPELEQRWPSLVERLNRTSRHLGDRGLAFREALTRIDCGLSPDRITLSLAALLANSTALQAEMIRYWCAENRAPVPPVARLEEFLSQLAASNSTSFAKQSSGNQAEMRWAGWQIKRHAEDLWFYELPGPPACPVLNWDGKDSLDLGEIHGQVKVGNPTCLGNRQVRICSRDSLENFSPENPSIKNKLKEIMRLSGVPPWLRNSIPLLIGDQQLLAVGDWWLSSDFSASLEKHQTVFQWLPNNPVLNRIHSNCHNSTIDAGSPLV